MTDQNAPLSAEERAELEALRAEKARREEEELARRERAELEALRAERAAAARPAPVPRPVRAEEPVIDPENLTFGQKMVMTREEEDDDGIPPMPPAQKLIISVCVAAMLAGLAWIVLKNLA